MTLSCSDVCEAIHETLKKLGFFKLNDDDEDHADMLEALTEVVMIKTPAKSTTKNLGLKEALIGRTLVGIRKATDQEMEIRDWQKDGFNAVLMLDDGSEIWAMRDEEGNGPGTLIHTLNDMQAYIQP